MTGSAAATLTDAQLVERIWARDASLWTGADEDRWLGWLDAPGDSAARVEALEGFRREARAASVVLLGMGGSSLAPEVMARAFGPGTFHVLDTTHPRAIRRLEQTVELERTLFLVSSKSGSTIETRSQLEYFWLKTGGRGEQFVAITDPGSELEQVARERRFRVTFHGEPTIGGRYSALSVFGVVPAALIGVDVERLLLRTAEMVDACRGVEGNPGLELGKQFAAGLVDGRDKVCISDHPSGFGLWAEQLIAESTGKQGTGLIPAPGESADGDDRQAADLRLDDPYELGQEFFRWEFATAVAGALIGVNPFDQPNVQEAKDRTGQLLASGEEPELPLVGNAEELFAQARAGDYVAIQAFVDPTPDNEARLLGLAARAREETGCVVTWGYGPRYLHSTGQLHKGGPPTGLFLQVIDDVGEELSIPGRDFGFGRLIRAQAAGDFAALAERGLRGARMHIASL